MQFKSLKANKRNLTRGCAMLLIIGAVSGCSSQVARFGGVDTMATASTDNQRSIIEKQPVSQPYPGDVQAPASNNTYSRASVSRSSLQPVSAASSMAMRIAESSAATGLESSQSAIEPGLAQGWAA